MAHILQAFLQQATASGSKSTALRDLRWFAGIVLSALLVALHLQAPQWILICIVVLVGIVAITYLGVYLYFAIKSPDALRSETFAISKMALERSIVGDNLSGLIDPEEQKPTAQLPPSTTKKE